MKKSVILLSILASALVGGATAYVISMNGNKENGEKIIRYHDGRDDLYFTGDSQKEDILPDFTEAAEKGVRAVVNIDIVKRIEVRDRYRDEMDMFEYFFGNPYRDRQGGQSQQPRFYEQKGGGSGVIISADGYIVSNNHVVEGADEIKVTLHNGDYYTAKVVGTDPSTDIALLKVDAENLPTMEFGDSDGLRLGQWVLAIGNPYGLTSTVTQGIISAKGRSVGMGVRTQMAIDSFIQTDAVVNPGNSGGALITLDGRLVGINTMLYSPTGSYSGYSFAVPVAIVRKVVADIREYGIVQRATLGISMAEINEEWLKIYGEKYGISEHGGIFIHEVLENSAAEAAGIKEGDILTAINDRPITSASGVQEAIGRMRPNDKVKISVKRDGKLKHFDVTLRNKSGNTDIVTKPNFDLVKELGATFAELTEKERNALKIKGGIRVLNVDKGGLLARSGVRAGYVLTAINGAPITKVSQLETMTVENVESIDCVDRDGMRIRLFSMKK